MAIDNGSLIEFSVQMKQFDQSVFNVWQYVVNGALGAIDPALMTEAWWDAVQAKYRLCVHQSYGPAFFQVKMLELGVPGGAYADFPIPTAERTGTRSQGNDAEGTASFFAVGVRLTVGSRVTRPGQKRFAFLLEDDIYGQNVGFGIGTAVDAFMDEQVSERVLGIPSLGTSLSPIVVSKGVSGGVVAWQPVTGYSRNPLLTSQVSRKAGRGI